jgi:hypothetical protein
MKKNVTMMSFLVLLALTAFASSPNKYNLIIAPVGYGYGECGYIVLG